MIVGYFILRGRGVPPVPKLTSAIQVTQAIGIEGYPTWSLDGGRIAYHSNQSDNWDIWVTQLGVGSPVNMTEEFHAYNKNEV